MKFDPLLHKRMYGNMDDLKNILPVVKQLYLCSGAMHNISQEMRKKDAVTADNFVNTFVEPARIVLCAYMPFLVQTYPQSFDKETRESFGVE